MQASYARPVLSFLASKFSRFTILTFDRKLFPHLSQDTVLALCEGYGEPSFTVEIRRIVDADQLSHFPAQPLQVISSFEVDARSLELGRVRAAEYRISPEARGLYRRLVESQRVRRLGSFAKVGIGYVTGANDFFHLSDDEVSTHRILARDLQPAIRRGRDLAKVGLQFTLNDWKALRATGGKYHLFFPSGELDHAAERYVQSGHRDGVSEGYKCRSRKPWWRVPWVTTPDLILTVMSGAGPRLVANAASVVSTNTLHTVRLLEPVDSTQVAAASLNSLTLLSAEVEGHALGGGMLKLEPSEADQLVLPLPTDGINAVELNCLDAYIRQGRYEEAIALGDKLFLGQFLGLCYDEIQILRTALEDLRTWRRGR